MQLEASMSEVRAAIAEHSQVLKELKVKEQRLQDEIFTCKQRVSVSPTCVFFLHPPPPPLNENSSLHLSRPLDLSTSRPLDLSTSRPLDLSRFSTSCSHATTLCSTPFPRTTSSVARLLKSRYGSSCPSAAAQVPDVMGLLLLLFFF